MCHKEGADGRTGRRRHLRAEPALATLQVTWIYNEFYWATVLMQSGDKFPITSSLTNLRGQFFTDYNLLSAGSVVIAIPVLIIFFLLQKQFVAGLTLGSTKG
jgi:multiple sugar transport system permease protein